MVVYINPFEDGKGWFLAYIDRDPQTLARKKEIEKMLRKQDREEDEQRIKIDMLIREGKIKEAREEAYLKVISLITHYFIFF